MNEKITYEIITDKDEILKWQKRFEYIIQYNTKKYKSKNITYKNKSEKDRDKKYDIHWSSDYNFWSTSFPYENDNREITRYKNWFGTKEPINNNLPLDCEISISSCINRESVLTASRFVVNSRKKTFVVHNGKIKKGKDEFWKNFDSIDVNGEPHVEICELSNTDYKKKQKKIKDFIDKMIKIKKENQTKSKNANNSSSTKHNESSHEIAQRVREIIIKINEKCRLQKKKDIFDQAALFKLWGNIEKPCKSRSDFKGFAENIYKLLREATRYINPNKKNRNDPYYIYMIPDNFIKKDPTKQFWGIVNTLRHYFVHDEIGNIAVVYKELLGKNTGPESEEEYLKLQIEVLILFEQSMEDLDGMT